MTRVGRAHYLSNRAPTVEDRAKSKGDDRSISGIAIGKDLFFVPLVFGEDTSLTTDEAPPKPPAATASPSLSVAYNRKVAGRSDRRRHGSEPGNWRLAHHAAAQVGPRRGQRRRRSGNAAGENGRLVGGNNFWCDSLCGSVRDVQAGNCVSCLGRPSARIASFLRTSVDFTVCT